jgi:multicomponent Na+:H+ antiporter subunit E
MKEFQSNPAKQSYSQRARRLVLNAVLFGFLWWILAEGQWTEPVVAVLCIAIAVMTAQRLWPSGGWRLHARGILPFAVFFVWHAVHGGVDVARRAMQPRMQLEPGFLTFPLRLSESQTVVFIWTLSLLPGTASVQITEGELEIHVLDRRMPVLETMEALERRVKALCE